jgi:hypothetical protein
MPKRLTYVEIRDNLDKLCLSYLKGGLEISDFLREAHKVDLQCRRLQRIRDKTSLCHYSPDVVAVDVEGWIVGTGVSWARRKTEGEMEIRDPEDNVS